MYKNILLVCLGNICRSALAQPVVHRRFSEKGLDVNVDSAGTGGWHAGAPADARAVVAGRLRGYDLSSHTARIMSAKDFERFDLILAMDQKNITKLEKLRPVGNTTRVELFTASSPRLRSAEIPDPYYSGKFDPVIEMIEVAAEDLRDQLIAAVRQ